MNYLTDLAARYADNRLSCDSLRGEPSVAACRLQDLRQLRLLVSAATPIAEFNQHCVQVSALIFSCSARQTLVSVAKSCSWFAGMTERQLVENLTAVKGIGRWTAGEEGMTGSRIALNASDFDVHSGFGAEH